MRALVVNELEGPDAIAPTQMPEPQAGPGEVLVGVVAAGSSCAWLETVFDERRRDPMPVSCNSAPRLLV